MAQVFEDYYGNTVTLDIKNAVIWIRFITYYFNVLQCIKLDFSTANMCDASCDND